MSGFYVDCSSVFPVVSIDKIHEIFIFAYIIWKL